MAKRKQAAPAVPKTLLIICIISGVSSLILRMLNRRVGISELGEIAGYAGTAFVITLLIIITIFVVNEVNKS